MGKPGEYRWYNCAQLQNANAQSCIKFSKNHLKLLYDIFLAITPTWHNCALTMIWELGCKIVGVPLCFE